MSVSRVELNVDRLANLRLGRGERITDAGLRALGKAGLGERDVLGRDRAATRMLDRVAGREVLEVVAGAGLAGLACRHALASLRDKGPAIQYWMVNRDVPAYLGPMDSRGLWFLIAPRLPGGTDLGRVDAGALVRRSCGLDFDIEILHADPWTAHRLIADRYGTGRVFLAGDACHLHPPSGGHGMNMGIGDAVDLGWKLAASLQGWGGPALPATYELERRPVHERVIRAAVESWLAGTTVPAEGASEADWIAWEQRKHERLLAA